MKDPAPTASALLTDLYQLTMMQAYLEHGVAGDATFDLFVRRLPAGRNFLLVAGIEPLLGLIERLGFATDDLEYLDGLGLFEAGFLDWLAGFRFSGSIDAMAEGSIAFAGEPILRVTAPIAEAQLLETVVMNQVHVATLIASKAARIVLAAGGRGLLDFGLRRMHGTDAGLAGARAAWIAGFSGTSNVLAGKLYGIPVAGTMAHSYVQCHADERRAFSSFVESFPETVLLVDTYDTLRGVDRVIELARRLGADFRVRGIRLDSGELADLARRARRRLDEAGLARLEIVASGNLDEWRVRELANAAPIDAFGVGTRLGTSEDAPNLDIVYKLAQLDGRPLLKLSTGKATLPGVKQVWRRRGADGKAVGDVIGLADEDLTGEALLEPAMRGGRALPAALGGLDAHRRRAASELARLPAAQRALEVPETGYPVTISDRLAACRSELGARVGE